MAKFRVLLVDDEEELVTALVERLSYRDINAEFALNGTEALQKLHKANFDIVVLDLKLPGMDGIRVLKNIKMDHPELPVLLITGHGSPGDGSTEIPEGAHDYLPKPIDIELLIKKMQEAIAHSGS